MENTEQADNKKAISCRIDTSLHTTISQLADAEDRPSLNNMVERLLKTHPQVQEAQAAEATA